MGETIKVTIKKDATLVAEGHNFKGKACEATMDFIKKIGDVKSSKKKPEYWDPGSPKINVKTR